LSRQKGNIAEDKAVAFLVSNNYKIRKRNFYSRFGEIDIIAINDDVIHFVEVKSGNDFEPIYNITPSKIKKIIKTAQLYMKKNNLNISYCIDAIIIENNEIDFVENITF
jgi:putative endonuclease